MIVYEIRGTHANVNVVKIKRDNWMVREKKYIFPNFVCLTTEKVYTILT